MRIEDIAKLVGVSKSTVSLAINNKPGVGDKTRQKILEVVKESGYTTRSIIENDHEMVLNRTVEFLVCANPDKDYYESNISTSFFQKLINGMERACSISNYRLIFSTIHYSSFHDKIEQISKDGNSAGTILLATNLNEDDVFFASERITNLVVVDNIFDLIHTNFVVMNNQLGAYDACKYLIELGHTKIGYVQSKERLTNFRLRKKGFQKAIEQNKLNFTDEVLYIVRNDILLAQEDFKSILDKSSNSLPTAIFCENDYMAIGVMKALQNHGKRIPEDISVIGFDNVAESIVVHPELTTINVQKTKMGELTVTLLINTIENNNEKMSIKKIVDTSLIERKSCRKL